MWHGCYDILVYSYVMSATRKTILHTMACFNLPIYSRNVLPVSFFLSDASRLQLFHHHWSHHLHRISHSGSQRGSRDRRSFCGGTGTGRHSGSSDLILDLTSYWNIQCLFGFHLSNLCVQGKNMSQIALLNKCVLVSDGHVQRGQSRRLQPADHMRLKFGTTQ